MSVYFSQMGPTDAEKNKSNHLPSASNYFLIAMEPDADDNPFCDDPVFIYKIVDACMNNKTHVCPNTS